MFCSKKRSDPLSGSINNVLLFLTELFESGLGYSAINTARSALSVLLPTFGADSVGNHRLVRRLLRGVFLQRPALPKYNYTWDVTKVLQYLKTLEPIASISLKLLTFKLAMLVALLSGQRIQTVHLIDINNIEFRDSTVVIRITELVKQSRPGFHIGEVTLPKYTIDETLCVYKVLKMYLERTKNLRKGNSNLFVSYNAPHGKVTKACIGRWLKVVMASAGINIDTFAPHSVRSASVSKVSGKIPLTTILKTAGWSQSCVFRKFYDKPVLDTSSFGLELLQSV